MRMPSTIETGRLHLRHIAPGDFESFRGMDSDEEVTRFVGGVQSLRPDEAIRNFTRYRLDSERAGLGWKAVVIKDTGAVIGWCGVQPNPKLGGMELGYRLAKSAWGKGYATEAAKATVESAFSALVLGSILATIHPGNVRSIRVAEKLGFARLDREFLDGFGQRLIVFELPNPGS